MFSPGPLPMDDPFGVPLGGPPNNENAIAAWHERQQRQRSMRFMMMFIFMLLLMEGEEPRQNDPHHLRPKLPKGEELRKQLMKNFLADEVYSRRRDFDAEVSSAVKRHPRLKALNELNGVVDVSIVDGNSNNRKKKVSLLTDASTLIKDEGGKMIHHFPRVATGYYRGEWSRQTLTNIDEGGNNSGSSNHVESLKYNGDILDTDEAYRLQSDILSSSGESIGLFLLDPGFLSFVSSLKSGNSSIDNTNSTEKSDNGTEQLENISIQDSIAKKFASSHISKDVEIEKELKPRLSISDRDGGKAAFQLFSKPIPGMEELSLVDGFIKMYDGTGYNNRGDILLRAKGILVHGIGRLSLLANTSRAKSVFLIQPNDERKSKSLPGDKKYSIISHSGNDISPGPDDKSDDVIEKSAEKSQDGEGTYQQRFRKLQHSLGYFLTSVSQKETHDKDEKNKLENLRDETLSIFSNAGYENDANGWTEVFGSENMFDHSSSSIENKPDSDSLHSFYKRRLAADQPPTSLSIDTQDFPLKKDQTKLTDFAGLHFYPYIPDDINDTIKESLSVDRKIPSREKLLEIDTFMCEFQINLDAKSIETKSDELKELHDRRMKAVEGVKFKEEKLEEMTNDMLKKMRLNTIANPGSQANESKEPFIDELTGTISSTNCNFNVNVTARGHRIDWEGTRRKATNYSFYMMLTCLTQIVLLLRQLLHSQGQSAATRVSLLCIGWQTVLDAILCICHVFLCQKFPPFVASFFFVAFFKLLIFGVIEMKYMALIVQARSRAIDPNISAEFIRRKVTVLQMQFYGSLFLALIGFYQFGVQNQSFYVTLLYSFWVPQILQNIITEAKRPLHTHYIYGMSLTRLAAPLYLFGVPNNFWKDGSPDFQSNYELCQLLVLWVGVQTCVLIAQGKYGARFMIPTRFLPPKFDYSRPIPPSILPRPDSPQNTPASSNPIADLDLGLSAEGTRKRINGNAARHSSPSMTVESEEPAPTLDCVICYSAIDIHNRRDYMLAPCDHIFHRQCLKQWMDVKMECPVCRMELPSL